MATSSNLVRIAFIEESTYGETPVAGNFNTARFISEKMSGTPDTVESAQIRTDRMSSGQVVTGLKVEGALDIELAKESQLELLMASAMYNAWSTQALVTVDLDLDTSTNELTRASGSWSPNIVVGDFITLSGFVNSANNVQVMVTSITSATVIEVQGPAGLITETAVGSAYKRADKITIGTTKKSFSMEKTFTDLTNKAIIYKGMIAGQMDLSVAFGELVKGSITMMGNEYITADSAPEFITDGRTINAPATTQTFNGSVDMPFITTNALGTYSATGMDIQSLDIKLNNNLNPQNVIGDIAPRDYTPGTAAIEIGLNAYLTNAAWGILANKITQDPFGIGFMLKNNGGWYGFYIPQVQVSFEDPASGGQNQDVMLDMSGTAKVGASGESALTIYRS